jgi:glycosyltransferase involved in cell wall biosynthesis
MTFVSLLGPNNMPPIEAISFGCPLIYSNIPGHIEQMEGTGMAVNATNPIEICEAIYLLYSDCDFRNKIISEELKFSEKLKNYSYFEQLLKLFDAFSLYIKTWKTI